MRSQEFIDKHYLRIAKEISNLSYALRMKVGCVIVKDGQIVSDGYNGTPSGFCNCCEYHTNPEKQKILEEKAIREKWTDENWIKNLEQIAEFNEELGYDCLKTKPEVLHAETNAITKLSKSTFESDDATIYITHEPCFDCSKLIIQAGIKRVVYWKPYRLHDGIELLKQANIEVVQYDNIDIKTSELHGIITV